MWWNPKKCKSELSKRIKIIIVTNNGIPLNINIGSANKYDYMLLIKAINNRIINCNTNKYHKHNQYKQYFLGINDMILKRITNFFI